MAWSCERNESSSCFASTNCGTDAAMNRKRVMVGTRLKVESIIFVDLICAKKINVSKLKDDKQG